MVIGEITSSQQDIMFVQVRVEDTAFIETHNGTVKSNYFISNSIGQKFSTTRWMGRIKIKIGNVNESSRLRLSLWDSPAKTRLFFENEYQLNPGSAVLHLSFNPLPAGDYYWELERLSGSVGVSVVSDSTLHKAYTDGNPTTAFDVESKIMYVTDEETERPVAVVGDTIDSGVTTISGGSQLGKIMVGSVEKNISREGDSLANGGKILQGCWFFEMET
ncbi:MAG: hypothetical protein Q7J35_11545 [Candidatus Methanoperedens sp.]|nr:hypothetical protein [Candidatus Methanoperedens sp.]